MRIKSPELDFRGVTLGPRVFLHQPKVHFWFEGDYLRYVLQLVCCN